MSRRPLLVAFDFDHTIVDDNSDTVVRRLLKGERASVELRGIYDKCGWTAYMERIFRLLHESRATSRDIEGAVGSIPAVDGFPSLLKNLHSRNVEIIVISDSNSVFINHWLRVRALDDTIERVYTNPAWYDNKGLLNIRVYHEQDWCKLSEKNMCKGQILEDHVKRRNVDGVSFERVAYVGDGRNDLCPILRLSDRDFAFPRLNYSLIKLLSDDECTYDDERVARAEIIPWNDGTEIWREIVARIPNFEK